MSLCTLTHVTKAFGGVTAVDDLSFEVREGEILGLIGPNGAGKTTVFNLITGNYQPDRGEILFEGRALLGLRPHRIVQRGIARTFQTIRLFQNLSVLENVLSGCHCRMRGGWLQGLLKLPAHQAEEQAALEKSLEQLTFVGLLEQREELAKSLSYGNQRLLEIARALATAPKLLILDEPAGGMNEQETLQLIQLIRAISESGITILLIEHDMSLVMTVCHRLVVLEHGVKIAEGSPQDIQGHPRVIEAYLGVQD